MVIALLLSLGQFIPASISLDILFRLVPVTPDGLSRRLTRWGLRYAGLAALFALIGGAMQWRTAGFPGLSMVVLNGVPWWLLWRFGIRKQFGDLLLK